MDEIINAVIVTAPNFGSYTAQVYDALTGTTLHTYKGLNAASSTLAVTGPDRVLLCACKDRPQVQAWQMHSHDSLDVRISLPGRVTAMAVSPSQPTTLVAAIGEVLHVYSLESGCRLALVRRHFQPVTCVTFFPCGGYFVSAGEDGFLYVWSMAAVLKQSTEGKNAQNIQPYKQLGQHSDKVTSVRVSGGTQGRLVSTSCDHSARVYDLYTMALLHTVVWSSEITTAAISGMATRLALASITGHIAVVDLYPYNESQTIKLTDELSTLCHEGPVNSVSLLLSGCTVVSAGEDGEVKVWAVEECNTGALTSLSTTDSNRVNAPRVRLALQRTIHRSKGPVTNMAVLMINRKAFMKQMEDASSCVQQFVSLHGGSCLDAPVTVTAPPVAKRTCLDADTAQHIVNFSLQHCSEQTQALQFLMKG
uniref:WD repeat-containing protein 18-like n=1 Tax=Hirondellea gigas TaxID=1518452 RepID=A0A2P2I1H0_9CRUS